ncbi:uncharacterized protein [Anabrus simplex]|uniref:uncharacterized protein n=1 Tax=Anabrus simplex TaxID=316456 RepID=UPI0035A389F8
MSDGSSASQAMVGIAYKAFIFVAWLILFSLAQTQDEAYGVANEVSIWSYNHIRRQDVVMDPKDYSLSVNSLLNIVVGQHAALGNVKVSATAALSPDLRTVIHLHSSSYEPENMHFSPNSVYSAQHIHKMVEEIKPHLDKLLTGQLINILENHRADLRPLSPFSTALNVSANEIIDDLLFAGAQNISDNLPLPDVNTSFDKGYFKAWNGWLRGLKTVYRTTDASLLFDEETQSFKITSTLSLAKLKYGYNGYETKYSLWKFSGRLDGSVGQTSANIEIAMKPTKDTCHFTLLRVSVTQLEDIMITLTGLGIWEKIVMKYVYENISNFKGLLVSGAESKLNTFLSDLLFSYDCSKYFHKTG